MPAFVYGEGLASECWESDTYFILFVHSFDFEQITMAIHDPASFAIQKLKKLLCLKSARDIIHKLNEKIASGFDRSYYESTNYVEP